MEDKTIIGNCPHWSVDGICCASCGEPVPEENKSDYGEVTREQLHSLGASMSEAGRIISRTIIDLMEKLKELIDMTVEKIEEIQQVLINEYLKEQKVNLKQSKIKIVLKIYSPKNIFRKIKQFVRRKI